MTHPFVDLVYASLFDLETEEDLEAALIDWSELTPLERSFTAAAAYSSAASTSARSR